MAAALFDPILAVVLGICAMFAAVGSLSGLR
jgi:hypothetical protein